MQVYNFAGCILPCFTNIFKTTKLQQCFCYKISKMCINDKSSIR